MGPTIDSRIESMPAEQIAEVVIDTSDSGVSQVSSLSSSDSDLSSSSDDLYLSLYEKSHSKENRPLYFSKDELGGYFKVSDELGGYFKVKDDQGGYFKVTSSGGGGEESYQRRRQRNNAAVKRSRDKARQRQHESQRHLAELTAENRRLQLKADVLLKELSLLRGLFPAVGATAPRTLLEDVDAMLADSQ